MGEVSSTLPSKNLPVFFLPHHPQNVKFILESYLKAPLGKKLCRQN